MSALIVVGFKADRKHAKQRQSFQTPEMMAQRGHLQLMIVCSDLDLGQQRLAHRLHGYEA